MSEPLQDPREQAVVCRTCGEPVFFIEGKIGPERWVHVRTEDWICAPRCAECGDPATDRVGYDSVDGGGMPVFVTTKWLCGRCVGQNLTVERT